MTCYFITFYKFNKLYKQPGRLKKKKKKKHLLLVALLFQLPNTHPRMGVCPPHIHKHVCIPQNMMFPSLAGSFYYM